MHRRTLETLQCPACMRSFQWLGDSDGNRLARGLLLCRSCHVGVPVLHGFPLFAEQILGEPADLDATLARIDDERFGDPLDHERFLRHKRRRPSVDLYAAFQPFNESSRSLFAFVPMLGEVLAPGDVILDLWCRTGWTGELLTGLFPEQHVVSVWEGNSDVLGYRGFRAWFDDTERRKRWDIVFHHPGQPLPFEDGSVGFVHGLDTLHRYPHRPLIPECLRVCREDGVILFPHVHLTNDEPDPFFERGETQLHGTAYRRYFENALQGSGRRAMVLSEKDLFERPEALRLRDDAETSHYNGCVAIVPATHHGRRLAGPAYPEPMAGDWRVIANPLLEADPSALTVAIGAEQMNDGVAELLERHPLYHERLIHELPDGLTRLEGRLLYWAARGLTVDEIVQRIDQPLGDVHSSLADLQEQEIVQVAPVSAAMARLQSYYALQFLEAVRDNDHLGTLWTQAVALYGERPYLHWTVDDSVFTYADVDEIVQRVRACFAAQGLTSGDRILLHAIPHPEFHFAFWAAVLEGLLVVVVDPELNGARHRVVLDAARPKLALVAAGRSPGDTDCPQWTLGGDETDDDPAATTSNGRAGAPMDAPSFLDLVEESSASEALVHATADAGDPADGDTDEVVQPVADALTGEHAAVVLFTSGSTGAPKGVVLSHGGLVRSAECMDRAHAWRETDRYLATGGPHTMSGLRNSCITPLWSGASVVLAPSAGTEGPLQTLQSCMRHDVTLLNTTPPFLGYCVQLGDKIDEFRNHRLRGVLSTGSALPPGLQAKFEERMGCPVWNYYGLTETSGACLVVPESQHHASGVGIPIGCVAQILRDNLAPVADDEIGELTIESDSLLLGYLTPDGWEDAEQVRGGLLFTGDLARRNPDGCIELLGRKDRLLVDRNGENFHPQAIEHLLDQRPDVVASRMIPVPQEDELTSFAALVVPAVDVDGDRDWCDELEHWLRDRLPPVQAPAPVLAIPEIPVGRAGKWDPQECLRFLQQRMEERSWI